MIEDVTTWIVTADGPLIRLEELDRVGESERDLRLRLRNLRIPA